MAMKQIGRHHIHPDIAWVNESQGRVRLVIQGAGYDAWLEGGRALVWRTLWMGYDPEQWNGLLAEEGESLESILIEWTAAGWVQIDEE